jgi:hypothetical protein
MRLSAEEPLQNFSKSGSGGAVNWRVWLRARA